MYGTDTIPVQDAPGAECLTVRDGKIEHMRIIFDRLPSDAARRAAASGQPAGDTQRRRASRQRFDESAVDYRDLPGVSRATMFDSDGLRVDTKFLAFVGRDGQLIVKPPAAQAVDLVADGEADPVRAGRASMREWIGVPSPDDEHTHTDQVATLGL